MPICELCEKMAASSEMKERREPHKGKWRCRDKAACKQRAKEKK